MKYINSLVVSLFGVVLYGGVAFAQQPVPVISIVNAASEVSSTCEEFKPVTPSVTATAAISTEQQNWKIWMPFTRDPNPPPVCPTVYVNQQLLSYSENTELLTWPKFPVSKLYKVNVNSSVASLSDVYSKTIPGLTWKSYFAGPNPENKALGLVSMYSIEPIVEGVGLVDELPDPSDWLRFRQGEWLQRLDNLPDALYLKIKPSTKINNLPQVAGSEFLGNVCPASLTQKPIETVIQWEGFFFNANERAWVVVFSWTASNPLPAVCPHLNSYVYMPADVALQHVPIHILLGVKKDVEDNLKEYRLEGVLAYPNPNNLVPQPMRAVIVTSIVGGMAASYIKLTPMAGGMPSFGVMMLYRPLFQQ